MNPQFNQPKGSLNWVTDHKSVARVANVAVSAVIFSSEKNVVLDSKTVIYDEAAEKIWGKPSGIPAGSKIVDITGSNLTYTGGTVVTLIPYAGSAVELKALLASNAGAGNIKTTTGLTVQEVLDAFKKDLGNMYYNVKSYGAIGDGVADDTAAIQAAVTAAGSGGTLYFPHGVYNTTATINLTGKKCRLLGDGINQTIIRASASLSYLLVAAEASTTYSFNEFRVEGIQFDGNTLTQVGFNLAHRHYCTFRDVAFFNCTTHGHMAKNSWLNNYYNCVFGASPVGVSLQGSNHRNAFYSCSWVGCTANFLQIVDGADGNSAINFNNCDFEFQNGTDPANAVYIASTGTYSFNDCYIGESINGTILFMDGSGSIVVRGGILFNGVSATGRMMRTSGSGSIFVKDAEINGGSYASIQSLGSQFGTRFSLENCRCNFSTLGVQTLAGEGLNRLPYVNPVATFGKAWTLNVSDGTATQSVSGIGRTCTVTSPSTSGLMFLTSSLDLNKLSTGLGAASGRYSRIVITYQSNINANLYTVNTVGGAPVNSLGSLPVSPSGKSCVVIAADITGGSILEIGFSTGPGAVFTLYDVTVIEAVDCTNDSGLLLDLFKAK